MSHSHRAGRGRGSGAGVHRQTSLTGFFHRRPPPSHESTDGKDTGSGAPAARVASPLRLVGLKPPSTLMPEHTRPATHPAPSPPPMRAHVSPLASTSPSLSSPPLPQHVDSLPSSAGNAARLTSSKRLLPVDRDLDPSEDRSSLRPLKESRSRRTSAERGMQHPRSSSASNTPPVPTSSSLTQLSRTPSLEPVEPVQPSSSLSTPTPQFEVSEGAEHGSPARGNHKGHVADIVGHGDNLSLEPSQSYPRSGVIRSSQSSEEEEVMDDLRLLSSDEEDRYAGFDAGGNTSHSDLDALSKLSDSSDDETPKQNARSLLERFKGIKNASQVTPSRPAYPLTASERITRTRSGVKAAPTTYYPAWKEYQDEAEEGSATLSKRKPKTSLLKLLKEHQLQAKQAEELRQAQAEFEAGEQPSEEDDEELNSLDRLEKGQIRLNALDENCEDEEERVDRADKLRQAVLRTEALETDPQWLFFDHARRVVTQEKPSSEDPWQPQWATDHDDCREAFLSGFACDWGIRYGLSPTLETPHGPLIMASSEADDRQLRNSYAVSLSSRNVQGSEISSDMLISAMRRLGVTESALSFDKPLVPKAILVDDECGDPYNLPGIDEITASLEHMRQSMAGLSGSARRTCLQILLRMAADFRVSRQTDLKLLIRDCMTRAIASHTGQSTSTAALLDEIAAWLFQTVQHPLMQLQIINSIPSQYPQLHTMKRRLALAYALQDLSALEEPLEHYTPKITRYFDEAPAFDTLNRHLSYRTMTALVQLMDIGIDHGFNRPINQSTGTHQDKDSTNPSTPSFKQPQVKAQPNDATFNAEIDMLSKGVQRLEARIKATGASHMRRTEAKGVLEQLHYRLQYGIRTRMKPQSKMFGALAGRMRPEEYRGAADMLNRFLTSSKLPALDQIPAVSNGDDQH